MLEKVTGGFTDIIRRIRGEARFTERNIAEIAEQIRDVLVDADVALKVADEFVNKVRSEALGGEILKALSPSQAFIGLFHRQLTELLGANAAPVAHPQVPPCPILVTGLQGSGKTTTCAKLAVYLQKQKKYRVMAVSTDVKRPAAIEQLRQLCEKGGIPYHDLGDTAANPLQRATAALSDARKTLADYVIVDTAGRSIVDSELMAELGELAKEILPVETLLVLDATQGQEALATARAFDAVLAMTGLIVTKLDGDARGGAALSARAVLGQPVKMIGTGEGIDALEPFVPERMASRILGMGDIVGLYEQTKGSASTGKIANMLGSKKFSGLSLEAYIEQIRETEKMGGVEKIAENLPHDVAQSLINSHIDKNLPRKMIAAYQSMTPAERASPDMIKSSRKKRIAAGAAVSVQIINRLLFQHKQAKKFIKRSARNPKAAMQMFRSMLGNR